MIATEWTVIEPEKFPGHRNPAGFLQKTYIMEID